MKQKQGLINYLGCPLFVGKTRNIYFSDLVYKDVCRTTGWKNKQLTCGGKKIFTKHFVQAIPIHLFSAVTTPATVLRQIQGLIADFFWGWKSDKMKYHSAS